MSGTFRNLQMTTLLAVSLAVVMVQRTEGYSHKRGNVLSYGVAKEPTTSGGASSRRGHHVSSSLSKDYRKETEVAGEVVPHERSFLDLFDYDSDSSDDSSDEDTKPRTTARPRKDTETESPSFGGNNDFPGIMQNPMLQTPMLQNPMMPNPMMQNPMMPNPMMQNPMLQNPMLQIPMLQYPMLQNPIPDHFVTLPAPMCENSTYCLEPPQYPSDAAIESALAMRFVPPVTEPLMITRRLGLSDESLCLSREQIIVPKTALGPGDEWEYVLNTGNYQQTVRVELCEAANRPCQIVDNLAPGYTTFCKQKYIYRNLVGIGSNGPMLKPFKMPSSCCCHVKLNV